LAEPDSVVGLIAGAGAFPEVLAGAVKSAGRTLVCVQVAGEAGALAAIADHYQRLPAGAMRDVLGTLSAHAVREVLVSGQFPRTVLLARGDAMRDAVLHGSPDRRDARLLERLAGVLAELGMILIDQPRFVRELLPSPGVLTARPPTPEEAADIAFGRSVARRLADLDVGQTVVLRHGIILAVEAAEGTDATIRRGGAMTPGAVVVKASRNHQDPRFDIPAVGPDTIAAMRDVGARALCIDARRTLVLHRERMIPSADDAGITVVAADAPPLGTPVDAGA
jgi:DUF1009 family protein